MSPIGDNPGTMDDERRPLRADAERNRRRLLDAATAIFCERGLDVGVGEIAERAGVGRGTLFRNFPTKEHLIAAIVVERMQESVARGRAVLDSPDPGEALFALIEQAVGAQTDRALFDALDDAWLANDDIHAAHTEMMNVLEELVQRAQKVGSIRDDISAVDVMMMVKGACEAARSFQHVDPDLTARQLDLVRAAISATPDVKRPLRGRQPTLEDLQGEAAGQPGAGTVGEPECTPLGQPPTSEPASIRSA